MAGNVASQSKVTHGQISLLPLKLTDVFRSNEGTADLKIIGRAENGREYAIKTIADTKKGKVPASELFCYELAKILKISTPSYEIITMSDSTLAFGSAWEGGVIKLRDQNHILSMFIGSSRPKGIIESVSKIYALDTFINNIDRHFGNYIFRNGYQSTIILAMDFSRAWYEISPFHCDAIDDKGCNTAEINAVLRNIGCYDQSRALDTIVDIENLPTDFIRQIMSRIPDQWLSADERHEFVSWWQSPEFYSKIAKIKKEI